jgi:hypothetical protein
VIRHIFFFSVFVSIWGFFRLEEEKEEKEKERISYSNDDQ